MVPSLNVRGRFYLDVSLFAALFLASRPDVTGLSLHEWLAALLVIPSVYHVAINWDWVKRTIVRLVDKLKAASRINIVIDTVLFGALVTVTLSGFMLLPGFLHSDNLAVVRGVWHQVHVAASDITIFSMLAHLFMHSEWMLDAGLSVGSRRADATGLTDTAAVSAEESAA